MKRCDLLLKVRVRYKMERNFIIKKYDPKKLTLYFCRNCGVPAFVEPFFSFSTEEILNRHKVEPIEVSTEGIMYRLVVELMKVSTEEMQGLPKIFSSQHL